MRTLHILTLSLLLISLTSCNLPTSPTAAPIPLGSGTPQTWMDAPLDQMVLPLAPYEIVFHASDDSAIQAVQLQINGQEAMIPASSSAGKNLVTVKYLWSPSAPGEYTLLARSQNLEGTWSNDAAVTIWVGDLTPTITNTPTVTPTLITTFTPTLVITSTHTPTSVGMTFTHAVSASQFYYGRCTPTSIDIEVTISGMDADSVVLFVKLNDQSSSETTGWISFDAMDPKGNGRYLITVTSSQIEGYNRYNASWMVYQFVATKRNEVVARSESFMDVSLSACGIVPLVPLHPPVLIVTPTNTPQIIK